MQSRTSRGQTVIWNLRIKMRDNNTERIGVYATALLFTKEIDWIFREQPLVDVGIDALIEQKIDSEPTGKFISAQIKTGQGNFHNAKDSLTLYVTKIHYNYWLNSNLPVIIIAHLPDSNKTTWEVANKETFKSTQTQWKIQIPKSKNLDKNSIGELSRIISGANQADFELQVRSGEINQSDLDKIIDDANSSGKSIDSLNNITNLITKLGEGTERQRLNINKYAELGLNEFDKRVMKSVKTYSELMNSVTYKLDEEIEDFAKYYSQGIRSYEKLAIVVFHVTQDYILLQDLHDSLIRLKPNMRDSIEGVKLLRNSVSGLPTKYAHLKKARLKFLAVSNQIIEEFKLAQKINNSFIEMLEDKLG